ncbi:MAG TPA: DUF1554 domain-containing protein, partial [Myxococcales bacterium]|nr:DUF1554 domain-containing protein [Myxococcales bacterium]
MTITLVDNQVREYDPAVPINFAPVTATAQDPGYQGLMVSPFYVYIRDDERIIFTLSAPQTGNMAPGFNPTVADPDYLCSNDPPAYMELFGYPRALVAAPGSEFTRIASVTPNQGDGQVNWVLTAGHNYIRDTRNGPVIGRANSRNLLDFPLQNAPTTSTSYWTGLNADWTTSGAHCIDWVNNAAAFSGQAGAGGTNAGAISSGPATCNTTRTILCVES